MPFTGKATHSAGPTLPEIAEDVADLVAIAAGIETPLLDLLGDAPRPARSVVHEWIEDRPIAHSVTVDDVNGEYLTLLPAGLVRAGDQLRRPDGEEVLFVAEVDGGDARVTRGYGGTPQGTAPAAGDVLEVVANAAAEGADAADARFTLRQRRSNTTQIFAATIEVSGSMLAVRQAGVADEMEFQKMMRLKELARELESAVLNGVADAAPPAGNPAGGPAAPRTMRGILPSIQTHRFRPGQGGFPGETDLTEAQLNLALRQVWEAGGTGVDTIVVGGRQKRAINAFVGTDRRYAPRGDVYRDGVGLYESDFGVCRVVMSRHVPRDAALLLDSGRAAVLPLAGRSFGFKPLARTGDRECGQIVGEYTLEFRNEDCHGLIRGLAA